jgi:hypothetical protein
MSTVKDICGAELAKEIERVALQIYSALRSPSSIRV